MSMQYRVNEQDGFLECLVTGTYQDAASFNYKLASLMSQCHSSGLHGILYDLRSVGGYPDPTDRILIFAEVVRKQQLSIREGREPIRVVFLKDEKLLEEFSISLEVDLAGTLPVASTTDSDKAISWIRQAPVASETLNSSQPSSYNNPTLAAKPSAPI